MPTTYIVNPLDESALTSREAGGTGLFDGLMVSIGAHLTTQFEKNRITGSDYAKAWVASMEAAINASVQYLLQRDQAYLQAMLIQAQVDKAHYELNELLPLEKSKILKEIETMTVQLSKMQYEITYLLPKELEKADAGIEAIQSEITQNTAKTNQILYETANLLPLQKTALEKDVAIKTFELTDHLPAQVAGIEADTLGKVYNNTYILPATLTSIKEQTEAHRAKTLGTRTDGTVVAGAIGKQIALQQQQIDSYKRDAEAKVAKMLLDTWTVQKSMDEGLIAPTSLSDSNINTVMTKIRTNNGLT